MDSERFERALDAVLGNDRRKNSIGTYSEGTLHAVLKNCYETDCERQELKVGKYIADIIGQNGIIEIQTRQLFRMKNKIAAFLTVSDVTVVYPVASTRNISWIDTETGEISGRRRSPRHDSVYSAIEELYPLREFIPHQGFHFIALMLETEEYKHYKTNRNNGKKIDVRRVDRVPTAIIREEVFYCKSDYLRIIPDSLPERFTSADFAKHAGIPRKQAQIVLGFLYNVGLVRRIDRNNRSYVYTVI